MTIQDLHPHQIAQDWVNRIQQRMAQAGNPSEAIREVVYVVQRVVPIAVESIKKEPVLALPNSGAKSDMDESHAMVVLDLFVRGVSQMMKHLRDVEMPKPLTWHERLSIMEQAAFEALTAAKVLMASYILPGASNNAFKSEADLQVVMTQVSEELVQKHLPHGYSLKKHGGVSEKPRNMTYALSGLLAKTANPYTAPVEELPFYKAPEPEPEPELEPELESDPKQQRGTL